jgi:choline-sulfatase
MPYSAGVTTLRTSLSPDKPTTAKILQAAGYRTEVVGKMHFNRPGSPGLHGFDRLLTEHEWPKQYGAEVKPRAVPSDIRVKPQWRPFKDPARIWLNAEKRPYNRFDEDMPGTFLAREACRRLDELKDTEFALWVSFHEPHSPFDFPIEFRNRFEAADFTPPPVGPDDAPQIPLIFRDLTPDEKRGIIAAYYTSTAFLDRNIGIVLEHLRKLNLEEDTLVVYMPDHGYDLGHHGRFEKHCGYDPAMRVPLMFRFPGRIRRSARVQQFTESVDVPHTILDLLGVDPLPLLHGSSLRPYLEGRKPGRARNSIFSVYLENEEAYVRTDRWKFIHCSGQRRRTDGYETDRPTPGRYMRLYDLKNDPGEFRDVSAKHPEVVRSLRASMLERFLATHPEVEKVPTGDDVERLEWFLRPRDGEVGAL